MKKKTVLAAVSLVLVLIAIFVGSVALEKVQQRKLESELQAQQQALRESPWTADNTVQFGGSKYGFDHRLETFLFIGTDASGNSDPDDFRGPMADYLLLMVLDHTNDTIGYLHIDRNTVTDVRELTPEGKEVKSRKLQICTAHWYGRNPEMAAENTVYAVRRLLGGLGKIDGYFVMNFADIGRLNHAVGGVEVTVEDEMDQSDPALKKGETLTLSDSQAAYFLRARMGVGEGTNAERMARQRQYMASFFRKVKEKTMENPKFGLELWNALRDSAVSNMNGNVFSRIAQKLLKGTDTGIRTIPGKTVLGYVLQDGLEHEEFYADEDALSDVMRDLFSLVPIGIEQDFYDEDER